MIHKHIFKLLFLPLDMCRTLATFFITLSILVSVVSISREKSSNILRNENNTIKTTTHEWQKGTMSQESVVNHLVLLTLSILNRFSEFFH